MIANARAAQRGPVARLPVVPPPYFDPLLQRISDGDRVATEALGRHVHWGYWTDPDHRVESATDYAHAAEDMCRRVCDVGPVKDHMRVLDVGCGFGGTLGSLNDRYACLEMTGVNIDARQLTRAAEFVKAANGSKISWVRADACDLPLAEDRFDVVLALECVFHFSSRADFIKEAARVLKPNGRLVLSDFVPGVGRDRDAPTKGGRLGQPRDTHGTAYSLCAEDEYINLLYAAGFRDSTFADVTGHTLPTYPFIRELATRGDHTNAGVDVRSIRQLEISSRMGWLRYMFISATLTAPSSYSHVRHGQ
jgi:SAM-dependent methyltransferase